MFLDGALQFDPSGSPITAGGPSTNTLDLLKAADLTIGPNGLNLSVMVTVLQAFAAVGAATLQVQLQGSVDNLTWTTIVQSDAIPKASLVAKARIGFEVELIRTAPHAAGQPRYLRLNYVVANGPFTAGTMQADLAVGTDATSPTYSGTQLASN